MNLFSELVKIKFFEFSASSGVTSQTSWNGFGKGSVTIKQQNNKIIFKENGVLKLVDSQRLINIENEYVWEQLDTKRIRLYHSRFGYDNLVTLFDLIPIEKNCWLSENKHVCVDDLYSAKLNFSNNQVKLDWKISGPKKDESIKYKYTY